MNFSLFHFLSCLLVGGRTQYITSITAQSRCLTVSFLPVVPRCCVGPLVDHVTTTASVGRFINASLPIHSFFTITIAHCHCHLNRATTGRQSNASPYLSLTTVSLCTVLLKLFSRYHHRSLTLLLSTLPTATVTIAITIAHCHRSYHYYFQLMVVIDIVIVVTV